MRGWLRVLRPELYRLQRSSGAWFAFVCLLALPMLRVLAQRIGEASSRLSGEGGSGLESGLGWAPLVEGWRVGLALGGLMLLIHAARGMAGDRESGLLRLTTTRSASRTAVVMGRVLLAPLLVLLVFALSGLGAWLATDWFYDFGPLMEDGYEILSVEELNDELWNAAWASLPPLFCLYVFGLLISTVARSAVGAVATAVAVFLGFELFKMVLEEKSYWVFSAYSPSFVDRSAMSEMVGMAHGYSDSGFSEELMRMNLILPWPEAALLVILACLVLRFRRL